MCSKGKLTPLREWTEPVGTQQVSEGNGHPISGKSDGNTSEALGKGLWIENGRV